MPPGMILEKLMIQPKPSFDLTPVQTLQGIVINMTSSIQGLASRRKDANSDGPPLLKPPE